MIEHETDIADQGVALFTDEWKEKPRLEALLRSYLNRLQELEDTIWDVLEKRLLDNAANAQLDTLGKLVGQPRRGLDDATYRVYISARILVNRSKGRGEDIIALCLLLLGPNSITLNDIYPASFVVETNAGAPLTPTLVSQALTVARLIAEARAAGVGSSFHFTDEADAGIFRLSATDLPDQDAPHGLANDAGTTGGTLIGAF